MQQFYWQLCMLQSRVIRPIPTHMQLSTTTALNSQKPKRKVKKHTTTITVPEEAKCDCIGPPHPLSNLRHTRFYVPPDETSLERQYREARQHTQEWNQAFWASHNANFKKMRQEFIQNNLRQKYGDSTGKQTLTSDEMSKFYKSFLDKHLDMHREYNKEWYKKNVKNLFLSARVWLQQKMSSNR
uniref:Apoptogenic protein 1, mitochondrial n=1 Tax=Scylla olivacea TaxID=85551 RepID=A0A0P4WGC8_SCYOL